MQIGLLIIGDEILSAKRQDSHLAKFIELLAQLLAGGLHQATATTSRMRCRTRS